MGGCFGKQKKKPQVFQKIPIREKNEEVSLFEIVLANKKTYPQYQARPYSLQTKWKIILQDPKLNPLYSARKSEVPN